MGVVVLIVSLLALFTVTGGPERIGLHGAVDTSRFVVPRPKVEPPARKSIIVDTDGYAHRTADGMQMTKRDRTKLLDTTPRTFEYKLPETTVPAPPTAPAPILDVVTQPETKTVEDMSVPMMPSEETLLTTNQKMAAAILDSDPTLSEWARTTLRCSFRDGLLIVYGVVRDEQERHHIADLAQHLSNVQTVENQLHTLDAAPKTQPLH